MPNVWNLWRICPHADEMRHMFGDRFAALAQTLPCAAGPSVDA